MKKYLKLTQLFVALSSLIAIVVSHNNLARITGLVGSSYRPTYPLTPLLRLVSGFDGRNLLNLNAKHQSKRLTNNACHPNPCNGANTFCHSTGLGNNYQCVCKLGFVSILDSPFYGCVSDPCNNNRCRSPHTVCYAYNTTSYDCVCEPGYRPVQQSIEDYGCKLASCYGNITGDIKVTCNGCSYDGYESQDSICAETVDRNGEGGTIQSPDYPNNYDNELCVIWRLEAPECSRVQLEITDLEIEDDLDDACDDFLRVSYGNTPYGFQRNSLCFEDAERPYIITSPSNFMELNFYSDGTGLNSYRGFKLTYKYILK